MSVTQYGLLGLRKAWTPAHDEYLLELLLEQHNCGKTTYNLFRHEVFKTVTHKLNKKFGLNLEESQIRNRYNVMKKDYGVLKTILDHTGFRWDVNRQIVVADDKVWEKYTAVRSDARHYRWRSFPPYDQMSIIFEESTTEEGAVRKLQFPGRENKALEEVNSDPETVQSSEPKKRPPLLVDDIVDVDSTFHVNDTHPKKRKSIASALEAEDSIENAFCEIPSAARVVQNNVNNTLPKKRKSIALTTSGSNKRAQVEAEDCIENALYEIPSEARFKVVQNNVKDDRALYRRCLEELQGIEELNDREFATAVNVLKDDKNAIAFMTIKGPRRLIWLRSILHG